LRFVVNLRRDAATAALGDIQRFVRATDERLEVVGAESRMM
jgi:hypothetical protein